MRRISRKAESFTESVIREMNRLAVQAGAVSLAQGFPDFPAPTELKEAAAAALFADVNQYAIVAGAPPLRRAIAAKTARFHPGWEPDPDTEITVVCGATEGMIAAMLGLLDPGDEVIVFEPFYENYGPDAILTGATPRYVTLHEPDWAIDPDELRAAVTPRTRAIVVNSPHNPTGKVFRRDELELIANLCLDHDLLAFTDDIYEHIVFAGEHIPLATLPGMADRTVAINSMSKTYSVTGWRVGWVIAPADLTVGVRRAHDFLTVGAAAPLQEAATLAMTFPDGYYAQLARRLSRTARHAPSCSGRRRVPDPRTRRRLLRDDRHPGPHLGRRRHVRHAADRRPRDRGGAGFIVLLAPGARADEAALRLPEAARDAPRRRRPHQPDRDPGLTALARGAFRRANETRPVQAEGRPFLARDERNRPRHVVGGRFLARDETFRA